MCCSKIEDNKMAELEIIDKLKYILIRISEENKNENELIELLNYSELKFKPHKNNEYLPNVFNFEIKTLPEIYAKNYNNITKYILLIKDRISRSTNLIIDVLTILPDYSKIELVHSTIQSIYTPWEEINQNQQKLITDLKRSSDSLDFQNIGNTARTVMNKIANEVFDSNKHKPKDINKEVHNGKFKNQLHTYIDTVLSGEANKEFRKLAETSIEFVERSIDVMNTTTHKINAEKHFAEVCVISTISAISIIKLVKEIENKKA
jgi:hypothetical protein